MNAEQFTGTGCDRMAYRWLVFLPVLVLLGLTYAKIWAGSTYTFFGTGPGPSPTGTPAAPPSFTGSTAAMQVAGDAGVYGATAAGAYSLDGQGFINNQLLDDAQAAALVTGMGTLPYNQVETGANGAGHATVNVNGDNYYQNQTVSSYRAEC
jgi:hypothetical protein